ncbi:MAG: endo-1,4-beta-xylanase, partial [Planctomycetota bacterium]
MRAVLTTFSRSLAVLAVAFAPAAFASEPARPPLKEVYADAFHVGAAVYAERLSEADPSLRDLVAREFDSVSSRDMLKWAWLNPRPGVLEAEAGDAYVVFGEAQGMYTVGHVLFWHLETPEWVWRDAAGGDVSRDVLLGRMRERVRAVAARYGSRIKAWDVVNEALMENGTLRESPWSRILGESFVEEAFRIAGDELPPDVGLIYNDYNMHVAGKRRAVVDMIGRLKAQGLRIDGVGMQGHWHLDDPPPRAIEASIEAFHRAGVDVHVSELDVSVLPDAKGERTDGNDPYRDGLPAEVARRQADRYAALFGLFRKHADKIKRVTLWGVSDAHSFKNNFPIAGRTDHPMLFDRQGRPKPAYDAVVDVGLRGTSAASPAPRPFAWSCDGPFIDEE